MLQELGGWDMDTPETDEYGVPSAQSIAERLGFLSRSKRQEISDKMEDHTDQQPKDHNDSFDTSPAGDEDWSDKDSSRPDLLLYTKSHCSIGKGYIEANTRYERLSPEPLTEYSHPEFFQFDQHGYDTPSISNPIETPVTPYPPSSFTFPFMGDMCPSTSSGYSLDGWRLDNNIGSSTMTSEAQQG